MKNKALLVGLLAGAAGGLAVGAMLRRAPEMPHIDALQQGLAQGRGEVEAAFLMAQVRARHAELYAQRPHFADRALREHLYDNILPGLALYQALLEDLGDQEAALAEVERLLTPMAERGTRMLSVLGRLPHPFAIFRAAIKQLMSMSFPAEGWEVEPVEDSEACYAFNMRSCFYLDVLTAYGAPELTPCFCKLDEVMFEGVTFAAFKRTQTLGRGDDCCDFRYEAQNRA